MARLTEEMVIARTKASDLSNIRKLNCWGSELSDVSLLRKMRNVEVLSLSVNKIDNLSDFQFCRNLQELYVRKNEIRDLNQVCYLQDLPQLKNLWLGENPCAENDQYRPTVLRALPRLKMLDNVTVQPQEVEDAMRRGTELIHPEEMQDASSEQQWLSESSSPAQSPSRQEQSPPRRQVPSEHDSEPESRRQDEELSYYDTDRRNANYEPESMRYTRQHTSQYTNSNYECDEDLRPAEERYRQPSQLDLNQQRVADKGSFNNRPPYSRRPVTRVWNSNILSAVLCLIKELDYPSLEVVEMAVRSRMDEM
ncbi:cilia- and flagella-associated protein 410 [Anabrus simplex]|uniref:cilia- and flagella-associated protein 410 n=1 Tax=Anabrus simplex TaxID=316456 RepID=UPI0034DD0CB5